MIDIGHKFKRVLVGSDPYHKRTYVYEVIAKKRGGWWIIRDLPVIDEPPYDHLDYEKMKKHHREYPCRYDEEQDTVYLSPWHFGCEPRFHGPRYYLDRYSTAL